MKVYIPTYKRLNRQPTLEALSAAGVASVLVVRPEEAPGASQLAHKVNTSAYRAGYTLPTEELCTVMVLPDHVSNIGQTRQCIVDQCKEDKLIMMDDDLAFACRYKRTDNPLYLSPCDSLDVFNMVQWMWNSLGTHALVGISAREGNNRKEGKLEHNARMMRAWGLRTDEFKKINARFDSMSCMEDFDVILTFLTNGYSNIINNEYTTNQAGSNVEGGCSTYRTIDVQAEAAHALAAKYPGIVKAVQKETKGSWGGGIRTDVNIQWKKAYSQGLKKWAGVNQV